MRMPTDTRKKGCAGVREVFQVILLERNACTRPLFSHSLCHLHTHLRAHTQSAVCGLVYCRGRA